MDDRKLDLHDLDGATQSLVRECEVSGRRTIFTRDGRPLATILSWDEFLALKETIEIGADDDLLSRIERAEDEIHINALMLVEDLDEE